MRVDTINFLLTVLIVPSHAFFNKVRSKTSCEPLPHPRHGQVDCTSRDGDGNFNIGAKCTFSCNPGYELEGTLKTSCNRKGQWTSRQIPECVEEGNELIPATPPQDVRLDAAAESLAQFHQPKQASPIDHGLNISSDVMVKFLEFILENPQTNSAHAFSAFQRGDLTPTASEEEPSVSQQYDFEEMESPEVLYDDEYESDFYKSFDDQMFQSSDWSTSWEDPSMDWLQQAHIDHIDNKLEVTTFSTTTLSDLINPTTSSTTTSTTTTRLEVSQPVAQLEEVANDKIAVSWSKSDVQGSRAVLPVNYRVSLYDRSTRRLIRTETTSDTFVKMEELDSETEYAVQVTAIVDGQEEAETLESNEAEVVVKTSPKPPTVTASNIGPTAIRIHWSRITSALSYVVTVLDEQGDQVFSDFKFPSFDSMDVRNLYPNAQYDIIVHAILLDDRQVSTRITHRTSSPSELHIDLDTVTNSQISLSWSKSLGVTSYEVTLTLADVGAAVLNKKLDHETNSFDFHALLPFTAYEITVKAFYSHGIFVTATETTRTASIAPEVSADSVGTESSLVSWSRVPGAANFTLNLYQNNVLMQSHQLDSAEENFRLENLLPYTSYEAELLAHLSGESDLAGYVDFKTDPKSPEIEIQQVTESSVEFSWNPVPDALSYNIMLASNDKQPVELEVGPATSTLSLDNLDHWSQYTITVSAHQAARRFTSSQTFQTKSIAPVISNTETTSTSASFSWSGVPGVSSGYFVKFGAEEEIFVREKHFTMSDLTPYTSYNVVVTGRTPDGESYSTQQTIVTDPEPATLSLISVSSSGFVIEWTKVPESTVYLTTIRDQEGALVDQRRAHSLERFEFNNLSPFRQYKVQVAAQYAGKSLASEIDILTDPEPAVINVKHLGATYLSIWWPSVPGTKSYTVQLTDNQSNDVISEANLSNEDILVWEQGNLLPSTEYTVRVVSIQHAKQLENSITVRTLDVPAMPSLQIQDVRSTSVQLLWKRPTEWDQNEPHIVTPMFLELEYNINDSTENSQITVIEKKFSEHFVLNLEPGQHYVFALRAIYEFGASEPTRAGIVTAPLLSKTEVVSVSSTTAELSWEPVTGATSYFVWIEPEVKGQKSPLKLLTNELLLSGLDMETSYNISLVGELTDATTDKLTGISFVTSPPPPVLIIDEIKSTSMKLSSSFIADAVQYDIVYFPTQEPEYDALVTLHGHNIQRDVEQLEADTFYTFKLRAIMNDNTHTDWTEAVYTTAPEGAALWFDHIRSSSLELHWQPVEGALLYSIEIKPNVEGFPMIVEKSQQMITVDNLSPDTEYEFMLVTSVDFGRTDPSYATQKTVVASPLVTIDTVRSSEFEVSWENDESCNEYKVSMVPPSGQIFHDRNVVKVTDVLPDSDFTLDVVCSVDFGESDTAKVQVTSVIAPPQPVLESVRSTSAVLKWSNNEAIYSRFEVKLVSSESNELSILSGDNLVLDELSPNSDYIIQFDAYTINGEHCDTLQISLRTAPSPPEVILDSIRSSTADLLWNGALDFEHFEVTFEPSVGFLPDKIYGSSLSLENLQPGTTFNCKIVGVTESSRSDEFETSFTTAPASPLASIDTVRTSEMTISWDSVEGSTHAELTFFPEVDYANSEGRIKVLSHDYIAKQLSPSTDYQVSLSLVMNGNTKTDPVIMHRRTAPPAPIVVASDITSSQVQLAWSTIEDISHYVLDVFPKTEQVPDKLRTISKQLLTNSLLLKELRHDTLYQVQIKAVMFDESETEVGHLQVLTAPKKPTLMMSSVRTTSARVFWTKTSPRVTGYRVRVEPPINGQTNFDRNNTVLSLEGTEASVSYTVTVVALVEQGETDLSSLTLLTAPPPIEARSKQKRSTSIIIEWEPVPNAYRYVAMISPPTQTGLTKIPISKNFLQLVDLAPETDYRMVLTALAPRGAWTTDEHTCDFATGPELGAVLIQNVTSQAMFLSWPALDAVDYYTMTLTPPLPSQPNPIKVLDPTGVKLENMVPSTKYAIELCGFSTDPEADFHTDAVTYTHFTAPPAPILSFPIKKSRRLGLQWTQLPENFIYELDMRPIPVGYENSLPMKLTENEILVTGMEPETLYYFMIKARSSDNVLTTDEFVISQATAPLGPPIVVEPHNIRTTSALIEWEEIPNAVLYRLRAFSKSSDDYDVMYVTSDIHHVLQGLTKLTTYIVHVSATLEDGGETDISEIEFETAPEPPKIRVYRARVKRDATVSVNCSMNEIPDKASYSVNLSPPIGSMSEERTTTDFYLPAWGLKLGSPYMLGIFATMKDGKRTDVRSVQFKTPATPRCYSCNSVGSPDKCKEEVPCPLMGGYACMTFDRRENGRRMLTRGCKKRDACNVQRNSHKCYGRHGRLNQCILVGCCSDDLCNEGNNLNGPFDPHLRWLPDRRPWE